MDNAEEKKEEQQVKLSAVTTEAKSSLPTATVPSVIAQKETGAHQNRLETHYNELLKTISEIGRDIKPAYTNSKVSADRLKKNIVVARGMLRECLNDLDKLSKLD